METKKMIKLLLIFCRTFTMATGKHKPTLILISFDGFRHDYIDRDDLKNFKKFRKSGVWAHSLKPAFVTKTFPNHYTIVTGMYEESHGIISNYMYDPVYKEYFDQKGTDPKWWNNTTPIWISNEVQHPGRKSGTIFWPGSQVAYRNHSPYFSLEHYDASFSGRMRMDKMVELLLEPDPVNFLACYIQEPDASSHRYGPDHTEVKKVLHEMDKLFGYFIGKLKRANLYDKVNVMVVSDHGMTTVPPRNVIMLSDYLDQEDYDLVSYGTFILVRPLEESQKAKLYKNLQKIRHLNTYYKEDIPEKWHYKHNRRVTEIFAIADPGYFIAPNRSAQFKPYPHGDHGYSNENPQMHGIFLAHGPAFKKHLKTKTIANIDLYCMMCKVLDVKPHPHNGSLERVRHILQERTLFSVIMKKPMLTVALLSVCGILVLIVVLGCTISCYRGLVSSAEQLPKTDDEVPLTSWQDEDDDEKSEMDFPFRR